MNELLIEGVIKSFGVKQVLTDIFLCCRPGEIIGLLGRNGSGKSTLLQIVFGSLLAERKFVKVNGRVVHSLFDNRKWINYLPQDSFLPDHMKIERIISLFCDREQAAELKNNSRIQPLLGKRSRQLSAGERKLVEVYMMIFSPAEYLLIDEPFNGVEPLYKEEIKQLIKEASKKKGIIIADHDYRNVLAVATKIILMHDGGTKEIKHPDELRKWGYLPGA